MYTDFQQRFPPLDDAYERIEPDCRRGPERLNTGTFVVLVVKLIAERTKTTVSNVFRTRDGRRYKTPRPNRHCDARNPHDTSVIKSSVDRRGGGGVAVGEAIEKARDPSTELPVFFDRIASIVASSLLGFLWIIFDVLCQRWLGNYFTNTINRVLCTENIKKNQYQHQKPAGERK